MDSKRTDTKKAKEKVISFMKGYLETYIGDIPTTIEEAKEKLPKLLLIIAKGIGCIILGALFGSKTFFYSALPFGTALLCSAKKNVSLIYIGLLISATFEKTGLALPLFLIYTALYIARILIYRTYNTDSENKFDIFNEKLKYRIIEGVCASILISFYRAAYFGFLYYDLFGGLLEIAFVPLLVFLFSLAFNENYKFNIKREIGCISLIATTIFTLGERYVLGFSLSIIATLLISFYISKTAGALRGGVYGLVCGFLTNTALSPVFAINGISSGLLWGVGNASAITISCILSVMCGLYVEGFDALLRFVPEILLSSIIFMPLAHFKLLPILNIYGDLTSQESEETMLFLAKKKQQATEEHIEELSNAFSELSEVFYKLSDRNIRPKIFDTQEICDNICNYYCPKCIFKRTCWEKEFSSTKNIFANISRILCEKGYVEKNDVESYLLDRCMHMDRIIERINDTHACRLESMIKENKTEVFAMDYESMGHLLEAAVKINCMDFLPDETMRAKLCEACRNIKLHARNICAYGKRKLSIIAGGIDMNNMNLSANEIKLCFENICGVKLTDPRFEIEGDYITLNLSSARRFDVEFAASSNTKKDEVLCGDTICMFENKNDYFYSLISDGMGSGREAALTSRLSGLFLKKMLMAKNSKPVAIEMLNNFIRSKNTECFSTVDLLEIDLLNGQASFIKSGAAASYVLRNDKIFRISSNTMPVGITREINAEEVKFNLENNDIIVMVSDGVGQSTEDLVRVSNILTFDYCENLQDLSDKILLDAIKKSSRSDDITVGIIRVKEK